MNSAIQMNVLDLVLCFRQHTSLSIVSDVFLQYRVRISMVGEAE